MTKKIAYDPNALLFRWNYREDDGLVRLIGTDPELKTKARWFRWPDVPGGWEQREEWAQGTANATPADNRVGLVSGWPGAVPVSRAPGRPKKDVADDDRPVSVSTSLRRAELFEIMKLASSSRQSVSEWVAAVLRDRLDKELGDPTARADVAACASGADVEARG